MDQALANLGPWGIQLHDHLKEFKPTLFRSLSQSGKLQSHLESEVTRIRKKHSQLLDDGLHADQISELLRVDLYPAAENPNSL